jgi:hypothetical protein
MPPPFFFPFSRTEPGTIPPPTVGGGGISFDINRTGRKIRPVLLIGFCTNLPIFCENFTRFWTEIFLFSCNYLYSSEKKSYQQVNNSR